MFNTQRYFWTNVERASHDEAVLKAKEKALGNEPGSIRPLIRHIMTGVEYAVFPEAGYSFSRERPIEN
jgi:hypothetical protein